MSNWTATNELRFVARMVYDYNPEKGRVGCKHRLRILQQKWECYVKEDDYLRTLKIEWRDVPVVEEE